MFFLKFIRFLQGYVRFQAQGVFIERFLNLLARDRIAVWDGRKRGDTYTGCTRARSYRKMRRHAKKAGVRLQVIDKEGAPFHRRKYRKRKGLLLGFLLFAVFLFIMSGFVWRIEVNGIERLEESTVIAALERVGIRSGVWRSTIDVRNSERRAMLELPDVAWIALNIEGSTIHVEIYESTLPQKMVDPQDPCNIVAAETGQIITMRVYEGQPLLREGDTVMAGDVIVSGITEDRLGQNLFRHALAEVTARVELRIQVEVPLQGTEYKETGDSKRRRYLQALGFELPLSLPGKLPQPYRVQRESNQIRILGLSLPMSVLREEYILMEEVPVTYSEEQAKAIALTELAAIEKARLDGAEIEEKQISTAIHNDVLFLRAEYTCLMEIGEEKEILHSGAETDPPS